MKIGIVGLPNVGKSTLFNALLKRQVALAANYPFATIEPNVGVVDVPDERLEHLSLLIHEEFKSKYGDRVVPEKVTPAVVSFYDIAGLVKGASKGEGLGNQFLGHIREVDAIIQVVRDFEDDEIVRRDSTDPKSDIEIINTELILADIESLDRQMPRFQKELRGNKTPENISKSNFYDRIKASLDKGELLNSLEYTEDEKEYLKELHLMTAKPMLYVLNVAETDVNKKSEIPNSLVVSAKIESEISVLSIEDREMFMQEYGMHESGLDKIIKAGYALLGLETFLTAGPKEVRAWTFVKGYLAPQAAGVIHTDFERGFISAEIVSFDKYTEAGTWKDAKDKGYVRVEGKNYVMKDGDVVLFRFNV